MLTEQKGKLQTENYLKYTHLTCIVHSHKLYRYVCVCVCKENTYTDISKIWPFTEEDVRITNKHMKNVPDH